MKKHDFTITNRSGDKQHYWVCSGCWIDESIKLNDECGDHMFNDPSAVMSVRIAKRPLKKVPPRYKYEEFRKYRAACPVGCEWRMQAEFALWTVWARRNEGAYEIRVTDMKSGKIVIYFDIISSLLEIKHY